MVYTREEERRGKKEKGIMESEGREGKGTEDRILGNTNIYKIYKGGWDGAAIKAR